MRRQALLSGGLTALVAALVIGVTAAGLYLRQVNSGRLVSLRAPGRRAARVLARKVEGARTPPAAQQALRDVSSGVGDLAFSAVIVEPRSTKYRFLRKRRFLAHSRPQLAGRVLDKRSPRDKQLYDLASAVRRDGALTELRAADKPGDRPRVVAAAPIRRDGKHYATAVVVTRPLPLAPPPAWPIAAGIAVCAALGLLAGALAGRLRYLLVAIFALGLASSCWWWLQRVAETFTAALRRALPTADGQGAELAASPLGLLLATAAALALVGAAWRGYGARLLRAISAHRLALTLILPTAVSMLLLVFIPFGYGLALGFFNHANGSYAFVGLDNFAEILGGGGPEQSIGLNFYFTLGVTVLWTGLNVFLHVAIGLALALVLKDPLLGFKGIYRALLILPWAVPNYITALIWKGMFHYQYGAVNHVLELAGVEKVSWFSSFTAAFTANVTTNTWLGFPFMMVVSLGALQSIPRDVYEAAAVDGASRWRTFWHVTLPLLRPALFPAIILGSIWTFNMFNIIYLVSNGAPEYKTDILITEAYRWAFEQQRYGFAAAYALLIFVILGVYTLFTNRLTRAAEDMR